MSKTKLLFMGTPDFAVATLKSLYECGDYEIAVVTQPDKPKGRKYTLTPPEVKVYAEEVGLPVYQPTTLRDGSFDTLLRTLDPAIIVVAAYGKILPKSVIDFPRYGCINVHGSLLPQYRGAAPIQRALMDGQSETGITVMYMNEGLDTGDMLSKTVVPITEEDDFESLFDKMAAAGAELLLKTLPLLMVGEITPVPQDDAAATYAAKIVKEDTLLDFSAAADALFHRIRGLSPFPLAAALRGEQLLKIVRVRRAEKSAAAPHGTLLGENSRLYVTCGDGRCLEILEVLPAGKKRMSAADYLRGKPLSDGERLTTPTL